VLVLDVGSSIRVPLAPVPVPAPMIDSGLVTTTCSVELPGPTSIVSPAAASSTAPWMV
jgi:hypothetical protein